MENEFEIMAMLPEGKKNAVSSEVLTRILHLKSKRELQQRIAKERKAGALILSSSTGGYYTSKDPAEESAGSESVLAYSSWEAASAASLAATTLTHIFAGSWGREFCHSRIATATVQVISARHWLTRKGPQ